VYSIYQNYELANRMNYETSLDFSSVTVNLDKVNYLYGSDKVILQNGSLNINLAVISSDIGSVKIKIYDFCFVNDIKSFTDPNSSSTLNFPFANPSTDVIKNPWGSTDSGSQAIYTEFGVNLLNYSIPLEVWLYLNSTYLEYFDTHIIQTYYPYLHPNGYDIWGDLGYLSVYAAFTDARTHETIYAWHNCTVSEEIHIVFS
jgi:hypothetical protein